MKCRLFTSGFLFLPFFVFCQNTDSLAVTREVDSLIQVSHTFAEQQDFDKALEANAAAEKLTLEKLGRESMTYTQILKELAILYQDTGDFKKAETLLLESKAILEKWLAKMIPPMGN